MERMPLKIFQNIDVPKALKSGCAEVLIESGLPELVPTEYGGTAKA